MKQQTVCEYVRMNDAIRDCCEVLAMEIKSAQGRTLMNPMPTVQIY